MNWRDCRVLVTGAAGFLGSNLVYALHEAGAQVIGLLPNRSEQYGLQARGLLDRMDVWYGSLRDTELIRNLLGKYDVNVCFHLGAISQVRRAAENPVETFQTNIEGTWVLLDACRRRQGFRAFVGASTDKAYGDHGGKPYTEETALKGLNTYDVSKVCADMLMQSAAHQYGLPVVVTRCANLYGPGDFNWERIIPNTLRRIHRGQRPIIHEGASTYMRSFLSVWDTVRAYMFLAERAAELAGHGFNVSHEESVSVSDVLTKIAKLVGKDLTPEVIPRARNFKEIPNQRIDSTRIRHLGWSPRIGFDEGLQRTVDWYQRLWGEGTPPPLDMTDALGGSG